MDHLKRYTPLLLFLLNAVLKCLFLTAEPIALDEPFSVYHAQLDLPQLLTSLKAYNNPPLYELILHAWIWAFGISECSVRLLPMLFSSLAVVFVHRIGRSFFNERVALLAGLLFTFSTLQIGYAHDSRVYSLFLLLTLMSVDLCFRLFRDGPSKARFLLLILVNVLIVYAHYFGFFVWFVELLMVLLFYARSRNNSAVFGFFLTCLAGLLLYGPQILTLYERFYVSSTKGTSLRAPGGAEDLYNMIWSFSNAPLVAVLAVLLLLGGCVKHFLSKEKANPFTAYLLIWFFVPYLLMFLLSFKLPMFVDRYLLFITPAFYLLLAVAAGSLFPKRLAWLSAAAVFALLFVFTCDLNPPKKRAVQEMVAYIRHTKDPETPLLVCTPDFHTTFAYHYDRKAFSSIVPGSEYDGMKNSLAAERIYFVYRIDAELMARLQQHRQVLYLDAAADFAVPGNHIKDSLLQHFSLKSEKHFPEVFRVYLFGN